MAQQYANRYWKRWIQEYLPEITRSKWFKFVTPLKEGDLVVIVEPGYMRNCWKRDHIENVVMAKDGQTRSAIVRISSGYLKRPTSKLAKLYELNEVPLSASTSSMHLEGRMLENVEHERSQLNVNWPN